MFIILLSYKKPLDHIDKYLSEHKAFLDRCYTRNYFIVSGRKNPRTGGVIISQLSDRKLLDQVIMNDPFYKNDLADYEVIEFIPGAHHPNFAYFL